MTEADTIESIEERVNKAGAILADCFIAKAFLQGPAFTAEGWQGTLEEFITEMHEAVENLVATVPKNIRGVVEAKLLDMLEDGFYHRLDAAVLAGAEPAGCA